MKIDDNYDSRIGKLFPDKLNKYFFISDWDLHNPKFMYNAKSFYKKMTNNNESINNYYFINESVDTKIWLEQTLNLNAHKWYNGIDLSIFPNGTSAASVLLNVLNKNNKLHVLFLTPTYFTYIDILKDIHCSIYYYSLISSKGEYSFNIDKINELITKFHINMIIITYPLFGSGVSISLKQLKDLSLICNKNDAFLLVDYIYGGIDWNEEPIIFPYHLMDIMNDKTAVLISLSKNLFINGAKTCLVFASKKNIEKIEKQSVYTLGSMAQSQILSLKILYDVKYRNKILKRLSVIQTHVRETFELISSLCAIKNYKITDSDSGIFTLVGIPKNNFKLTNDDNISKIILEYCHILTIPHSRYLFYSDDYYWFRVNLSYSKELLIPEFRKLIEINFN